MERRSEKIILLELLKIMSNAVKSFDILATSLSVLYNYFDSSTKLLFRSVSSQTLDLLAKSFFPCRWLWCRWYFRCFKEICTMSSNDEISRLRLLRYNRIATEHTASIDAERTTSA